MPKNATTTEHEARPTLDAASANLRRAQERLATLLAAARLAATARAGKITARSAR